MKADTYQSWFVFTLIYLIIEYGRPQDILPIAFVKPGMIIILILTAFFIIKGRFRMTPGKQTLLIWLFILLLAAYVPLAKNNYYAFITMRDMLILMPFILSTIICVNSIDRLQTFIFIAIILMIYVSTYSFFHRGVGSGNFFQDENDLSLYINMWLPFCYFLFIIERNRFRKYLYLTGLVIGVLTIIVSFSRGGFIGLLCVAFVCWLKSSKKILSLILFSLIVMLVMLFASDQYWDRIGTVKDTDQGTAAVRIESWKAGWRMFLDNPLGVGGNNYEVRFPEYQSDFFHKAMWGRVAHSLWFTLIPETGIIGILIYLLLLKCNIKDVILINKLTSNPNNPDLQYIHALSGAFAASMAGYFSSGTFISVLYYPHYWYLTAIIVATANVAKSLTGQNNNLHIEAMHQP